jgi:hypothetical protein
VTEREKHEPSWDSNHPGRPGSETVGYDELQLEVKFNYNLIIKKIIAKIA